jgi:23S rRNA (cytidine1920-2'-O)/16S rRNA (cytidine1409-2'-O)-methyltransferase
VKVRDGFNVRYVTPGDLPDDVSLVTIDLSFISLGKVLDPLAAALRERSRRPVEVVALVKPQFEVGRGEVGKGGIVRGRAGFTVRGSMPSPIAGAEGNQEFLLHLGLAPDPAR